MRRKLGIVPASFFLFFYVNKIKSLESIHVTQYDKCYYKYLRINELEVP